MPLVLCDEICLSGDGGRDDGEPQESYSAVGLYNRAGGAPNCLVAKHEVGGIVHFFPSTEFDAPRPIGGLSEITDAHILAFARPAMKRAGSILLVGWASIHRV